MAGTLGLGFQIFQTCGSFLGQAGKSYSEVMVILTGVEWRSSQDWSWLLMGLTSRRQLLRLQASCLETWVDFCRVTGNPEGSGELKAAWPLGPLKPPASSREQH